MIASKEAPQHKHLFPAVTSVVTSLASSISPPAEQTLQLIQALLLLCNWPSPYGATIHDNSSTYCGLAVTYALRQGLHRPHHVSDFVYEADFDEATMRERKKTWLACFIVSQRYVSFVLNSQFTLMKYNQVEYFTRPPKPIEGRSQCPRDSRLQTVVAARRALPSTANGPSEWQVLQYPWQS